MYMVNFRTDAPSGIGKMYVPSNSRGLGIVKNLIDRRSRHNPSIVTSTWCCVIASGTLTGGMEGGLGGTMRGMGLMMMSPSASAAELKLKASVTRDYPADRAAAHSGSPKGGFSFLCI